MATSPEGDLPCARNAITALEEMFVFGLHPARVVTYPPRPSVDASPRPGKVRRSSERVVRSLDEALFRVRGRSN